MEVIEMFIDEKDETQGLEAVSVVEAPAIESNFIALSKQGVQLKGIDEKKRVLMGAILVPNKEIYRNQDGREFKIWFSEKTVRRAMELFMKNKHNANITEEHQKNVEGCYISEIWLKEDMKHDKSAKYGLDDPVGSIMVCMKAENDDIYQKALKGEIKGFSIEGYFSDKLAMRKTEDEEMIEKIKKILEEN